MTQQDRQMPTLMHSRTTKSTTNSDPFEVTAMTGKVFIAVIGVLMYCDEVLAQQPKHDATGFECAFIYDKFKGGKSGDASCSYEGENVFSAPTGRRFPATFPNRRAWLRG
jgi:hypothetical protein